MYSSYYSDWLNRIEKDWKSREQLSGLLQGKKMTGYFSPAEGVHVTVYENGVFTVVNYNDKPVTYQGITVPAIDFAWSQEGDNNTMKKAERKSPFGVCKGRKVFTDIYLWLRF